MAEHPARNLSVRCAVRQSGRVTCENLQRGSSTAITSATPVTARLPPERFKGLRRRHDDHRRFEVPGAVAVSLWQRYAPTAGAEGTGGRDLPRRTGLGRVMTN
jgi:hypothetical protein